jgi:hypothetical protein
MSARRRRVALAFLLLLALAAPAAWAQSPSNFTYNGVVHVSWWWNEYNNFDQPTGAGTDSRVALAGTNANWAGLLVTQYQDNIGSTVIAPRTAEMKTPTDASLRFAIRELRARGIKVMLKPHVDLWADGSHWRGQINPTSVDAWFQSYTQFIVHYAQLAQEEGVEAYVVGTELVMMTGSANRARWNAVFDAVEARYGGLLSYAANATFPADEFTSVSFWDRVDVMGLDGYFTLTNHADPTLAELQAAWTSNASGENLVAAIQNFSAAHGKPVIFTELGYKSVPGANTQPWNSGLGGPYDPTEQRNCYEAAFSVWSTRTSFMKGIFWWAWPVPAPGANDTDYNPRTKPAEAVLRTWQGPVGSSNFTLSATPGSLTVSQGASGAATIGIARTSFTGAVALSTSPLPSGVTASFAPASATGNSSTLTFTASATAATGPVTVTVTGTGGGLTRSTTVGLTIAPVAQPNFALSATPAVLTVSQGTSGASTIGIARTNFTGGVTFTTSALPGGVTASFSASPATGTSSSLTFSASATAATGTTSVTVTGSGGGLTRATTVSLTVSPVAQPSFTLAAAPASLAVARGASGASTISIARTSFTAGVTFSTSALPSGVTAAFAASPATGNSSVLTFTASATAATGTSTVTVTGTGGGLTRTTTVGLTVSTGGGGDTTVTVTPMVTTNSPWFNEHQVRINNTAALTALSVTVVIQRTGGISASGQYNTVGGQVSQGNSSTAAAITYVFTLAAGQTLGPASGRTFAAQTSGSGTLHPTSGDTWTVTYTTGGQTFTRTGSF